MESGNIGRFCIKILIVGILISHEIINNCRGAVQKGTNSSSTGKKPPVRQSRPRGYKTSDVISLLKNLITVMKGMKAQIAREATTLLTKQSQKIKKMANDIKNGEKLITDRIKKMNSSFNVNSIGTVNDDDCCTMQNKKMKISQHVMISIKEILGNFSVTMGKRSGFPLLNIARMGAAKQEAKPSYTGKKSSVRRSQRKKNYKSSSDIISLLKKLIDFMKGMQAQIACEVTMLLEKQSEEMTKIANDIRRGQKLIMNRIKKMNSSFISDSTGQVDGVDDCCSALKNKMNISQQLLISFKTVLANFTIPKRPSPDIPDTRTVTPVYNNCSDIRRLGYPSGAYRIRINKVATGVYCDFDTPGGDWLVFQRRIDGSVYFMRKWYDYTHGFGNVSSEFWLGNEILHQLTSNETTNVKYKLRIDLEDLENEKRFAEYTTFSIGPSSDYYRLTIGGYSGTAGDSLSPHNKMQFSTLDSDHDTWTLGSCAQLYHGAWWYGFCHFSNLNGIFYQGVHASLGDGVNWFAWRGLYYSLKSEMKIAPLN